MGCLGNMIWMIFGGIISALSWFFIGCLWSITIIGIPIGRQCFKMAKLSLMPFGKDVVREASGFSSLLMNILWLIFGGIELAAMHLATGLILAITIIGIPFAKQHFKLALLSLVPFGTRIVASDTLYMDIH
ncbi:YccF domain-containing protein [Aerococcaceae bacterium 50-4]